MDPLFFVLLFTIWARLILNGKKKIGNPFLLS